MRVCFRSEGRLCMRQLSLCALSPISLRSLYICQTSKHTLYKKNTLKILLLAKKCPPEKNQHIAPIALSLGSYQVKGDPDVKQDYSEVKQYSRRAIG